MFKAIIVISTILCGWLSVQMMWRYFVASSVGASPDEDALAGRLGCRSCECRSQCENQKTGNSAGNSEQQ